MFIQTWYPYRASDRLTVTPSWGPQVASVTVDGEPHDSTAPFEMSAQDHGREVVISAQSNDGLRSANYIILVMPHTFPPLKTQISSADDVSPRIITGMQVAPNNPTFAPWRNLRMLLYINGALDARDFMRKARMQRFDDFIAAVLAASLDFEHR